jgi:tetratricopeptide (TPR) repeat protein
MIYTVLQDWPNAESSFRSALQLDDKDSSTWFLLGRSHYLRNQLSEAKEAFEAALRLNRQGVEIYEHLALTLDRMNDRTAAEKLFKQGVETNRLRTPPDKRIHIAYGTFLFGLNRLEESCEQFRAAIKAAPQDPDGYFELAKALFHMKQVSEAAQEGESALRVGGPDYRVHYLLSRIYTALGNQEAASRHADRAAALSDKQP